MGSSFLNLIYALLLDKPVVLFGESLGYYRNPINRMVGKYIFDRVKLILVREDLSREYLLTLGIDAYKIHVTADPAFILPPAPRERLDEILRSEDIPELQHPIVGLNPSGLISRYLPDSGTDEEQLLRAMAGAIDYLVEAKDAQVLLIPHVYSPGSDDRMVIEKLLAMVSHPDRVFHISREYSADELKAVIGLCDLFIGARMHATIAATSLCIPTVGIAYSHKMHGIIGKTLEMEQYLIDVADVNQSTLIETIERAWSARAEIRKHLEEIIPGVKEKAYLNGYYLAKFLESDRMSG